MTPDLCEVCAEPLCGRGRASTGICFACRQAGHRFVGAWASDLREQGLRTAELGRVVGLSTDAARARMRDHRLREAARP